MAVSQARKRGTPSQKKKAESTGHGDDRVTASDLKSVAPSPKDAGAEAMPALGDRGRLLPEFDQQVQERFESAGLPERLDQAVTAMERAAETVLGSDDRTRIFNTTGYPYNTICRLRMKFGRSAYIGTGWFVGPRTIVTAGHNLFDSRDGWADSVDVFPGDDGGRSPLGDFTAQRRQLRSTNGWIKKGQKAADYGAITFEEDKTDDFLGFKSFDDDAELRGLTAHVVGYPGRSSHPDGNFNTMWGHALRIASVSETRLFYDIDTSKGQSGSPVFYVKDDDSCLGIGIHNYGGNENKATRINDGVFALIKSWKSGA